jgi:hypothetical protein
MGIFQVQAKMMRRVTKIFSSYDGYYWLLKGKLAILGKQLEGE